MVTQPPMLRLQLLGHIRAFVDGMAFRMATPRKTPQLLTYLLLHRGATVSRDFLAFIFWPDDSEDSARAKLRANLHDLVRLLPPALPEKPWISADGTSIRWNDESAVTLDVDEFESAIAVRDLERAVALYAGDLVEGLYDEWLLAPRERLHSAYLGALSELISQARRRLDYSAAIAFAKRLLQADPLREDVARRLVALRYEAGDRAGALDEYVRFSKRLQDELGIDPMPESAVLHAAILNNVQLPTAERPSDTTTIAHLAARPLLPFVGRQNELSRLLDGWSRAVRQRGGVAFIDGAPGIGKSRLVAELSRGVEERGGRVLAGGTGVPEAMPYQALLEALRGALPLLAATRPDTAWLPMLAALLPELSHLIDGVPPLRQVAPESERARTLAALAHSFVSIAQARPLLLVLEDLHWAQDATIAALAHIARRSPLAPIFVVVTYRDNDLPRRHPLRHLRAEALSAGWASGVTLGPLSLSEVAEIARTVASPLADSEYDLRTACAGNPLLLGQLLAVPATGISQTGELRIGTIVETQLQRLSPDARSFAEIAALAGARFSHEVVREAGGWDSARAIQALDELLDGKIITEGGAYGDFDYAFAHQLVCDVVAERAPQRRAADRHRRIAQAMEQLFATREVEFAAEVGRHYELAGDREGAARRYVLAGRRALQMSALEESDAYLHRCIELASDPTVRADAFVELVEVSRRSGDRAERTAALAGLDEAVEGLDDERRRTAALLRVQFSATESDKDVGSKARDRLRSLVECAGPQWRALLLIEDARAAFLAEDFEGAGAAAQAALDSARESGDLSVTARALVSVGRVRGELLDVGALETLEEAQQIAFQAGDGIVELEALLAAHKVAHDCDRPEIALTHIERALERAVMLGDRDAEAQARVRVANNLLSVRRDLRRALDEIEKSTAICLELGSRRGIARVLANRGIFLRELGDFAGAIQSLERARSEFRALGERSTETVVLSLLTLARVYAGDPRGGRRDALEALELLQAEGSELLQATTLKDAAIATAACGDLDEAIDMGNASLAAQRDLVPAWFYRDLLGHLGIWSARRGDLRTAHRHVDEMVAGQPSAAAAFPQQAAWAAAQILRAHGEMAAARSQLEAAYRVVATTANELPDDARARFESVPWNRAILAAHDRDEWPDLQNATGSALET